jgi:hypothetical protein
MSRKLDLILDSSKVGTQLIEEKLKGHREMEECISVLKVRIEELEAQRESLDLESNLKLFHSFITNYFYEIICL